MLWLAVEKLRDLSCLLRIDHSVHSGLSRNVESVVAFVCKAELYGLLFVCWNNIVYSPTRIPVVPNNTLRLDNGRRTDCCLIIVASLALLCGSRLNFERPLKFDS